MVPKAYPPILLATSHSRDSAAARSQQISRPKSTTEGNPETGLLLGRFTEESWSFRDFWAREKMDRSSAGTPQLQVPQFYPTECTRRVARISRNALKSTGLVMHASQPASWTLLASFNDASPL